MQITIDNPFEENDICQSKLIFYDKNKIELASFDMFYCKLRHEEHLKRINDNIYLNTTTFKKVVSICIKCIRTIGSKAI